MKSLRVTKELHQKVKIQASKLGLTIQEYIELIVNKDITNGTN
jgi:predicted DNA binding CopG/RHH family protein